MGYKGWENFSPEMMKQRCDPKRQWQGQHSRELGAAFEERIKMACEVYKSRDIAFIEKTPEPFVVTDKQYGKDGKFIGFLGHFEKPAQPDFKGTISGGREVCFEAKATEKDRIYQSAVTDEQMDALNYHQHMGALCFVVVSIGLKTFYRVPWHIWRQMKEFYGRKYMTVEDLSSGQLPVHNGILYILEGVKQDENRKI